MNLPSVQDYRHHQAWYYFGYQCQQRLKSELFLPRELANELIGPDTSPSLNQGVSACAHWGHNRT